MSEVISNAVQRLHHLSSIESQPTDHVSAQQAMIQYLIVKALQERRNLSDMQAELPDEALTKSFAQIVDEFQDNVGVDIRNELLERARRNHANGDATVLLDLGCGKGRAISQAQKELSVDGFSDQYGELVCVGADINPLPEDPSDGVIFIEEDASNLGIPDNAIDVCYCRATLTYVDDALKAIQEIYRTLKLGGIAVVSIYSEHICSNIPFANILENTEGHEDFQYKDGQVELRGYLVIRKQQNTFNGFPYKFIEASVPARYVSNAKAPPYTKLFRTARYEYIGG
jgi:SAM-dependent methyltransferase